MSENIIKLTEQLKQYISKYPENHLFYIRDFMSELITGENHIDLAYAMRNVISEGYLKRVYVSTTLFHNGKGIVYEEEDPDEIPEEDTGEIKIAWINIKKL